MIPKKLYHIWISKDECPDKFLQFTSSWNILSDYELINVRLDDAVVLAKDYPVLQKLIDENKYTLVNHYLRYLLLFLHGGICLDLDVQVVRSFDPLLDRDVIIGYEDSVYLNNAVLGCEPGSSFVHKCLTDMDELDYSIPNPELETGPRLVTRNKHLLTQTLPPISFYPYHYSRKFSPDCIKSETFAVHHWAASWTPNPKQF